MIMTKDYLIRKTRVNTYDIEQEGLIYSDMGHMYGMQCNHKPDSVEYEAILDLCRQIIDCINQIEKINKLC